VVTRPVVGVSLLGVGAQVGGGLASHVYHIARSLAARMSESYVFFVPRRLEGTWRENLPDVLTLVPCPVSNRVPELRVVYESIILPWLARRNGCEVLFYPHAIAPVSAVLPCVVTLHDLMYLSQPTYFSWRKRTYLDLIYRRLARSRVRLVTVSEFTRREAHSRFGVPLERMVTVVSGVDDSFFETRPGSNLPEVPAAPYLLAVAGVYPHKRLTLLIRAFERIAEGDPSLMLVLAGTHVGQREALWQLKQILKSSRVRHRIIRLGPLPWDSMPRLYSNAVALVHASAYEGYGLPLAEAMAAGVPVVAAPADGTLEVLGGWGVLTEGWGEDDLVAAIRRVLEWDAETRTRHVTGAKDQAQRRYRWSRVAESLSQQFIGPHGGTWGG